MQVGRGAGGVSPRLPVGEQIADEAEASDWDLLHADAEVGGVAGLCVEHLGREGAP